MQTAIPTTLMRGGTSKGLYFSADELPGDPELRDQVLLTVMGSPDARQIDGVGGAHPLTSKVAILSRPSRDDADIDYLFLQVAVDKATVSDGQNCGNILAGVGPWAIENGWVKVSGESTDVRIHMLNTGGMAIATVNTQGGGVNYEGNSSIDGVPGTAAAITLNFLDLAGASCGALLPTGNVLDTVQGVDVTCIDNGMPVVLMRATDLGQTGYESPAELEANDQLKSQVESLRLVLGERLNLGDVKDKTVPKMCLVAAPEKGGAVSTRSFIPHRVHEAIGVLGAVSVATACVLPGSVADGLAKIDNQEAIAVEHPTGSFTISLATEKAGDDIRVTRSALLRTARKLFSGLAFVPASLWPKNQPHL